MELLGARSTTRAATMSACPHHKFLAAGPSARAHGGCTGEASSVEILRLWRKEEEPESGRELEVVATIQAPGDHSFLRLAWSRRDTNLAYPLGLLAGALDGGAVCLWDPSLLPYEQNLYQVGDDGASCFTLSAFTSKFYGEPSTCSEQFDTNLIPKNFHTKCKELVEDGASEMLRSFDNVVKSKFTAKDGASETLLSDNGDFDGWEVVPGKSEIDMEEWELVPNKSGKAIDHSSRDGLPFTVLGLSFNNPYGNVLACGGLGEKLLLYHLDSPVKTCEMMDLGSKEISCQITSLDWHPVYPVILACACDASVAKIWDLRSKKPTYRFEQENKGRCTETRWNPNDPLQIAVASVGMLKGKPAIEIWDARNTHFPLSEFGPENGEAWRLNVIEGSHSSWTRYNPPNRITLHPDGKNEILWCHNDDVIAMSSSSNIGLYKLKTS
ncbi:unnamed protein product [Urochloa decumbens]|uniref:Uncharacterized protein n=1 Tax=Urochloa decumbens TaxID=240449 RepID=A0ABC8VQU6_9POAL